MAAYLNNFWGEGPLGELPHDNNHAIDFKQIFNDNKHLHDIEEKVATITEPINNHHLILSNERSCPIAAIPDEVLSLIIQQVQYCRTTWESLTHVNDRFCRLVRDEILAYRTAHVQFSPYAQIMESRCRPVSTEYGFCHALLGTVYDMYKFDWKIVHNLQSQTGHSAQTCMALTVLLKVIKSEMPRTDSNRDRHAPDARLEDARLALFRLHLVRSFLTPEHFLMLRYIIEAFRKVMKKEPGRGDRRGWLKEAPPRVFSYYTLFEDAVLRYHTSSIWNTCWYEGKTLTEQFGKLNVHAKHFERNEHFLGMDENDYEHDLLSTTFLVNHHSMSQALWSDLTSEEQDLIRDQARRPSVNTNGPQSTLSGPDQDVTTDQNIDNTDDNEIIDINTDIVEVYHIENLTFQEDLPPLVSLHNSAAAAIPSRLDKASTVHNFLMEIISKKFSDHQYTERMAQSLNFEEIRLKLQNGREMIWSMDEEECMGAVSAAVEGSDLKFWLA